ncbi:GDSL-type esterase/lipase family protein [Kitasatospora aureofaciens]|uniref:GDSL-type esterase/lipase family protein n=1 Tax=Kitasatospora aureofaciens TaxID=1894 RepID=UPI001C438545|nr:GDSL-type esterase/lipase family protein [Kitasatospora aureofaciens]MBV6700899.1 G-D-S-L family lipolytic protein [Kitasatospora aureofaciens]
MTTPTINDPFGGPRVCFLGDSFVQGLGDPEFRGWVGRALQAAAPDATAFNLGIRRNTSEDVRLRCRAEVGARILPGADNRLVLSVGANDAMTEDGAPRVGHDRTLANLAALLDGARERGIRTFVVGPPPVVCGGAEHLERLLALAPVMAALCAERGVPFVDVTRALAEDATWVAEANAADGAHPGVGGYGRLAGLVLGGGFGDWIRA